MMGDAGEEWSKVGEEIGEMTLDWRRRKGREGRMYVWKRVGGGDVVVVDCEDGENMAKVVVDNESS